MPRRPRSTFFPYTTLFRSHGEPLAPDRADPAPLVVGLRRESVAQELVRHRVLEQHARDRKSTRLNSSHSSISYAVFCLTKKYTQHCENEWNHRLTAHGACP